jgi:uncharacterized protein
MHTINGEAATANASRIIKRICKHWGHKYPVEVDEVSGKIQLNDVQVNLQATADRLLISLENPVAEVPQRLTGVVSEHLQRMAGAEENLVVNWVK